MALVQVETTGLKEHRCRYWESSTLVFISYALKAKGWSARGGGNRRRLREVYIIQASAGVSLATNGDVVPAQLDVAFVEDSSEITLEELDY